MSGEELERLIIRLVGDGSEYQKMLQEAQDQTKQAVQSIEGVGARLYQAGGGLRLFGERAVEAIQSLLIAGRLRAAFSEFAEAEAVTAKLSSTMEANGRNVEKLLPIYQKFAAETQRTTVLSDEAAMTLLRQAETYGLTGDNAQKAANDAIAFAGAVDATAQSAEQYLRLSVALQKGDIESARLAARYVKQLRGIKDDQKFLAEANRLLAAGMKTVSAEANTSQGSLARLRNALSDMMEGFGEVVATGARPFISALQATAGWLTELSPLTKGIIVSVAALTAALLAAAPAWAAVKFWALMTLDVFKPMLTQMLTMTAATQALNFAMAGLAGFAIGMLVRTLLDADPAMQKFNQRLKESDDLIAKMSAIRGKQLQQALSQATAMPVPERKDFLSKETEKAARDVEHLKRQGAAAAEEYKRLASFWDRFKANPEAQAAGQQMLEIKAALDDARARHEKFREELGKLKTPEASAELVKSVAELTNKLKMEIETVGMSAQQKQIHELASKGATDAMLAEARANAEVLKSFTESMEMEKQSIKAKEELNKEADELVETLMRQAMTVGMAGDAAQIYALKVKGASDEQIAAAEGAAGLKQAFEAIEEQFKEGERITEAMLTPFEKFAERVEELEELLEIGAISEETFGRAMEDAENKLDKAEKGAKKAKEAMQKFDAALIDSAEAAKRITAFEDMIKGFGTDGAALTAAMPQTQPGLIALGDVPEAQMGVETPDELLALENNPPGEDETAVGNGLLQQILTVLQEQLKKPSLEVEAADVAA